MSSDVKGTLSETPLEQAERHVREGNERIARQMRIVAEMERDYPRQAEVARNTLRHLQATQEIGLEYLRRKVGQKGRLPQ